MTLAGLTPDPWQAAVLRSTAKRLLMLTTRQAGKSTTTAALALRAAMVNAETVLLFSPSLRQSGELFLKVVRCFAALGRPVPVTSETATGLTFATGGRVLSLPGSESTVRGFTASTVVIDEAARVGDDLYMALRPMLATTGGKLVCLSTPFGARGWFFEAWANEPGWEKFKVTADLCPRITPEFLAEERRAMGPRWFSQEYECNFVDAVDAVFAAADIAAAVDESLPSWSLGVA